MRYVLRTTDGAQQGYYDGATGRYTYHGDRSVIETILKRIDGFTQLSVVQDAGPVAEMWDTADPPAQVEQANRLLAHYDHRLEPAEMDKQAAADTETEWKPYTGPLGGEGWQNVNDPDDVRYTDEPPGPTVETDTPDSPDAEEATELVSGVLPDGWTTEAVTWESSHEFPNLPPMDAAVIDRGDGPELVDINFYDDQDRPNVRPIDHPREATRFVPSSDYEPVDPETARILGSVVPELDEYGVPVDRPELDLEVPESKIRQREWRQTDDGEFYQTDPRIRPIAIEKLRDAHGNPGDPFEDKMAMVEIQWMAMSRIRDDHDAGKLYDRETVEEVEDELEKWDLYGYYRNATIWSAAMALTDRPNLPTQFDKAADEARFRTVDDEVRAAMCDFMRLSRETAKAQFGETVEVYRGIKDSTVEKFVRKNDDGSLTVRPQALESWTVDREVADGWTLQHKDDWGGPLSEPERRGIVVKMEFSTDRVGFHGGMALGKKNMSFKELTMLHDRGETYTIPAENVEYLDEIGKMAKADDVLPALPGHASEWLRAPFEDEDRSGDDGLRGDSKAPTDDRDPPTVAQNGGVGVQSSGRPRDHRPDSRTEDRALKDEIVDSLSSLVKAEHDRVVEYEVRGIEFCDSEGERCGHLLARVADTPTKHERGLSAAPAMADGEAMLFAYPDEDRRTMTMREMDFPIDICFADATGQITAIEPAQPDHPDVEATGKWVAEVPHGYCEARGIKVGHTLNIPSSGLAKDWVHDPSQQAEETRWRNTETNEYRYQPTKPGEAISPEQAHVQQWTPESHPHLTLEDADLTDLDEGDYFLLDWRGEVHEGRIDGVHSSGYQVQLDDGEGGHIAEENENVRVLGRVTENAQKPSPQADADAHPLSIEAAEKLVPLGAVANTEGVSAPHMEVAIYPDERKGFITHVGWDGEKTTEAERAVAADQFFENIGYGHIKPDHHYDRESRYFTVEGFDGTEAANAPDEWGDRVDRDEYVTFAAVNILAGNGDMHSDNVMINEQGELSAIDLDHSAGDFSSGGKFYERGLSYLSSTAWALGIRDLDEQEIRNRAVELAGQIEDVDAAVAGIENSHVSDKDHHRFQANIRRNIEAFQNAEVRN